MPVSIGTFELLPPQTPAAPAAEPGKAKDGAGKNEPPDAQDLERVMREMKDRAARVSAH